MSDDDPNLPEQGFPAGPPRPPVPATALALGGPPQTVPAPIPPPPQGAGLYPSTSMTPSPAADAFGRRDRGLMGKVGGALAAIGAFLAKGGWLLLTHLKFLAVAATMLISIAAYSLFFGWTFAAAFVIVILIDEMGHVCSCAARASRHSPMFIPFLGAVVGMREMPKTGRRGPRRARRTGRRHDRLAGGARHLPGHRERLLEGPRRDRLLPAAVQPHPGVAPRRRTRIGGAVAEDLVGRPFRGRAARRLGRPRTATAATSSSSSCSSSVCARCAGARRARPPPRAARTTTRCAPARASPWASSTSRSSWAPGWPRSPTTRPEHLRRDASHRADAAQTGQ